MGGVPSITNIHIYRKNLERFAGDDANRGANFDATIGGRLVAIVYHELKQR